MQQAIEFVTKKKRGKMIEIPEEYADSVSGEFRVILILNSLPEVKEPSKKSFKAFKTKTKGFKFKRDELYTDE